MWDRSRACFCQLSGVSDPHVSPRVGIVPAFLAGIPAPHANAESTLRGLGSTACCMPHAPLRPTYSSANGRVQPSLAVSSLGRFPCGRRSKMLQRIERVCSITMQLGTPAADSMDIAAAPAWLQSSIASGAGRDANLLLLHFGGNPDDPPVRERSSCTRARPTQAIRASFTP